MVWRDIDVIVRCQDPTLERVWDALRPLLTNPRVTRLSYSNETGVRSPTGDSGDQRFYCVLHYEMTRGMQWKIDISLWTSDAPRPYLAQLAEFERRLTGETRLAILWIKDVWHRLPVYPTEVGAWRSTMRCSNTAREARMTSIGTCEIEVSPRGGEVAAHRRYRSGRHCQLS